MSRNTYFISADIEGVTDVTSWSETEKGNDGYEEARRQMTREVAAACQAVLDAGYEVVVRDGHLTARNILHQELPKEVKLMRGWACHPGSMVAGIDETYRGLICIGYHAPAGSNGSPLAHTINYEKVNYIKVNKKLASEFTLNSLFAAQYDVPSVFLSGDKAICDLAKEEIPQMETVAVKECKGNSTLNIHPELACEKIYAGVAKAIQKDISVRTIPEILELEVSLKTHQAARSALVIPGVKAFDLNTVAYLAKSPMDLNIVRERIMG